MRRLSAALVILGLFAPAAAGAYSSAAQFDAAPSADTIGGAAGIYFTGSDRFQGQTCAGCHQGGEGQVHVALSAGPTDLFAAGYTPGQAYSLRVDLVENLRQATGCDAHEGEACDLNLFALEMVDAHGQPAGRLCPKDPASGCVGDIGSPTVLARDGHTLFANGIAFGADGAPRFRDGETAYDLFWAAPATDVGPVSLWLSVVDGDGASARADLPSDVAGDATGTIHVTLCGPSGCPEAAADGCRQSPLSAPGGLPAAMLLALALMGLAPTGRRRS